MRATGRRAQVIAALLAVASAGLRAEEWVDLQVAPGQPALLQLDRSSVMPAGPDRFAAVWRVGSPSGDRQLVKRGFVDCRGEFLQAVTATATSAGGAPGTYTDAVVDYRLGSRSWQGHTARLTDAERAAAYDYPAPGSASARLVDAICAPPAAASSARPDRIAAARRLQVAAGCTAPAGGGSPLCADDVAALAAVGRLDLRLRQASDACHLDGAAAARLQAAAFAPAPADCSSPPPTSTRDSAPSCGAAPASLLAALDADLARAAAGLPCSQTAERLVQAADDDRLADARARFQACVDRMLPKLDDRVSEADVIATGLFGACRGELPRAIAQGPRLQNGLLPELTAAVLEHRRSGRVSIPTPPRRRESQ